MTKTRPIQHNSLYRSEKIGRISKLGASLWTTHKQMETRNHFKTGRHRKAKRVGLKKQQK